MIKESQRSDLEDNIKDILKDIDVSYSTGITKKASRKEEMIACREDYIFSILTKEALTMIIEMKYEMKLNVLARFFIT
jgi:hypothetical protein